MTKAQFPGLSDNETCSRIAVNTVKVLEDADFAYVRHLCENHAGWHIAYDKKSVKIWSKPVPDSCFNMIKARIHLDDVEASTAYDVLHDALYRASWDKYQQNAVDIGIINPNNDVCYYAMKSMPPFRGRDFVLQRSWLDIGSEKFICSHSVCHEKFPPVKGFVRATVFLTAYMVREVGKGCQITYVTHADPKGKLPAWLSNSLTKAIGPRLVKKLHKACLNYANWKQENRPEWKPWIYPEQLVNMVRINVADCIPRNYDQEIIDESTVSVKDLNDEAEDEKFVNAENGIANGVTN